MHMLNLFIAMINIVTEPYLHTTNLVVFNYLIFSWRIIRQWNCLYKNVEQFSEKLSTLKYHYLI